MNYALTLICIGLYLIFEFLGPLPCFLTVFGFWVKHLRKTYAGKKEDYFLTREKLAKEMEKFRQDEIKKRENLKKK